MQWYGIAVVSHQTMLARHRSFFVWVEPRIQNLRALLPTPKMKSRSSLINMHSDGSRWIEFKSINNYTAHGVWTSLQKLSQTIPLALISTRNRHIRRDLQKWYSERRGNNICTVTNVVPRVQNKILFEAYWITRFYKKRQCILFCR